MRSQESVISADDAASFIAARMKRQQLPCFLQMAEAQMTEAALESHPLVRRRTAVLQCQHPQDRSPCRLCRCTAILHSAASRFCAASAVRPPSMLLPLPPRQRRQPALHWATIAFAISIRAGGRVWASHSARQAHQARRGPTCLRVRDACQRWPLLTRARHRLRPRALQCLSIRPRPLSSTRQQAPARSMSSN